MITVVEGEKPPSNVLWAKWRISEVVTPASFVCAGYVQSPARIAPMCQGDRRCSSAALIAEARLKVRCLAGAPAPSLKLCDEPGNERSDGQEKPVAELKHCHCSRQRGGTRRPAPSWQSAPYIHEGRRSRKKLPVFRTDMKSIHRLSPGEPNRERRIRLGDVDETKRPRTIGAAVVSDLRSAQRAGAVVEHSRFRFLRLHKTLSELDHQ